VAEADVAGQIAAASEALRDEISKGDVGTLDAVNAAVMPCFETVADKLNKLQTAIAEIGGRVDQRLNAMQEEVRRAAVKREGAVEVLLPSLRELRRIN
jgi:hypothetical protein